eukprot:TRINITY_DN11441_c0_g1_i3.p2 TRINITY_DN11441_c0_g1~~TRINITY_DN11441_c0_g1_i3.p2  ORF type:complete len:156 (+),score=28.70 TRINITY_DN11441_c0_g1_i3:64-531(+)
MCIRDSYNNSLNQVEKNYTKGKKAVYEEALRFLLHNVEYKYVPVKSMFDHLESLTSSNNEESALFEERPPEPHPSLDLRGLHMKENLKRSGYHTTFEQVSKMTQTLGDRHTRKLVNRYEEAMDEQISDTSEELEITHKLKRAKLEQQLDAPALHV